MTVLHCHNGYRYRGGEDEIVEQERLVLKKMSNKIKYFKLDAFQDKTSSLSLLIRFIVTSHFNVVYFIKVLFLVWKNKINVIHVHNSHFTISPSIFLAAFISKVKVVVTLHNYRFLHPSTTLSHKGKDISIQLIPNKIFYSGSYFYDSKILTFKLCFNNLIYKFFFRLLGKRIKFACVSKVVKEFYERDSSFKGKCEIVPNFVQQLTIVNENKEYDFELKKPYLIFLGRLEPEKGIVHFLERFNDLLISLKVQIVICGKGSELSKLSELSKKNEGIKIFDFIAGQEKVELINNSIGVLLPSNCHETFGLTIIEGYSLGKPALVSEIVSKNGIVENDQTGFVFSDKDSLKIALENLLDLECFERLSRNCLTAFKYKYSEKSKMNVIWNLYSSF